MVFILERGFDLLGTAIYAFLRLHDFDKNQWQINLACRYTKDLKNGFHCITYQKVQNLLREKNGKLFTQKVYSKSIAMKNEYLLKNNTKRNAIKSRYINK